MNTDKILAVETALSSSAALKISGIIYLSKNIPESSNQKSGVILKIDALLKEHSVRMEDLGAIGVNTGPGSFTGIRIGIALVKGFARPFDIPVVPVDSFQAVSHKIGLSEKHYIIINAGGGFLYLQVPENQDETGSISPAMLIHTEKLEENLQPDCPVILYGEKLEKVSLMLRELFPTRKIIESSAPLVDSIASITEAAVAENKNSFNYRNVKPCYIKPSYADL